MLQKGPVQHMPRPHLFRRRVPASPLSFTRTFNLQSPDRCRSLHLLACRAEANAEGTESDWAKTPIGSMAKGAVHDVKDYGIVCDLEVNPDVVGLAATHQVSFQVLKAQCAFAAASGALQRHIAPNCGAMRQTQSIQIPAQSRHRRQPQYHTCVEHFMNVTWSLQRSSAHRPFAMSRG